MSETKPDDAVTSLQGNQDYQSYCGLTKREYFAAQALAGLSVQAIPGSHNNWTEKAHLISIANYAVLAADALIKELNKEIK